jgi:transposase-like protein
MIDDHNGKGEEDAGTRYRRTANRLHYPVKVILLCVRWYAAYSLSRRCHIE